MGKGVVKFHLGDKGPAPCRATVRECPVGGEHFKTFREASERFEKLNGGRTLKSNKKILKVDLSGEEWDERFVGAPVYEKNAVVEARIAEAGERLSTVLSNGAVETTRVLDGGEYIVTNPGGEEYAMSSEKFLSRYSQLPDGSFKSLGSVKAIPNPTGREIEIMASWGEAQFGDAHCMIAENNGERYLIGGDEFNETYVLKNSNLDGRKVNGAVTPMAGGRYYGVHVKNNDVYEALDAFKNHVGVEKYNSMRTFKRNRDRGEVYHLTVVGPNEMNKLDSSKSFPKDAEITFRGIGRAVDGDNEAYFIVCESDEVAKWRSDNGLPPKDLHITLGFRNKDVHNKSKGLDSLI